MNHLKILIVVIAYFAMQGGCVKRFNSAINHMYVFDDRDPNIRTGYYPDTPELQDLCQFFQGFYVEFQINNYNPSGDDVRVCMRNITEVPESHKNLYITDYINANTVFPNGYGLLTPNVQQ